MRAMRWAAPKNSSTPFLPPPRLYMQESPPHKRFSVGCSSPFMRLAPTPHGASRLVQAMPAWSVETPTCSFPWNCRDARVYDHRTTAIHDTSIPPRTSFPLDRFRFSPLVIGQRSGPVQPARDDGANGGFPGAKTRPRRDGSPRTCCELSRKIGWVAPR